MDRATFSRRLALAAEQAREFASRFILEPLPPKLAFRVRLNVSYDATASAEFKLYPEDGSAERAAASMQPLHEDEVVDLLWREERVPQWIDIAVSGETGDATTIDLLCCGRFTSDEKRHYYGWTDVAPFGVKGPALPVRHRKGDRFSIYDRVVCWSILELERALEHRNQVSFVDLHGSNFDDAALARLDFPKAHCFALENVRVLGPGLQGFRRVPKLRTIRFRAHGVDALDLEHLPVLPKLEDLSVEAEATTLRGLTRLGHALPSLASLSLASSRPIMKESLPGLQMLRELRLHLPAIPVWPLAWARLHHLGLNVAGASDEQVREVLARCSTALRSLSLRGTDVGDAILGAIDGFALDYLDLADTRITLDALEAYVLRHPGLRYFPQRPPSPSAPV